MSKCCIMLSLEKERIAMCRKAECTGCMRCHETVAYCDSCGMRTREPEWLDTRRGLFCPDCAELERMKDEDDDKEIPDKGSLT